MSQNKTLFERSQKVIPGGVNSPVRAFKSVGGTPIFFKKGLGSKLWDEDGREYIDYINSWGPMILGHAHPQVLSSGNAYGIALDQIVRDTSVHLKYSNNERRARFQ